MVRRLTVAKIKLVQPDEEPCTESVSLIEPRYNRPVHCKRACPRPLRVSAEVSASGYDLSNGPPDGKLSRYLSVVICDIERILDYAGALQNLTPLRCSQNQLIEPKFLRSFKGKSPAGIRRFESAGPSHRLSI